MRPFSSNGKKQAPQEDGDSMGRKPSDALLELVVLYTADQWLPRNLKLAVDNAVALLRQLGRPAPGNGKARKSGRRGSLSRERGEDEGTSSAQLVPRLVDFGFLAEELFPQPQQETPAACEQDPPSPFAGGGEQDPTGPAGATTGRSRAPSLFDAFCATRMLAEERPAPATAAAAPLEYRDYDLVFRPPPGLEHVPAERAREAARAPPACVAVRERSVSGVERCIGERVGVSILPQIGRLRLGDFREREANIFWSTEDFPDAAHDILARRLETQN